MSRRKKKQKTKFSHTKLLLQSSWTRCFYFNFFYYFFLPSPLGWIATLLLIKFKEDIYIYIFFSQIQNWGPRSSSSLYWTNFCSFFPFSFCLNPFFFTVEKFVITTYSRHSLFVYLFDHTLPFFVFIDSGRCHSTFSDCETTTGFERYDHWRWSARYRVC